MLTGISEALATAILHHKGGRLDAAQQIYGQIIARDPNHADATYLFGMVAQETGKHEVAVEYIRRAIELKRDVAIFHHSLGDAYRALGRATEAVACYRRVLALRPDVAEAHNSLGVVLNSQGRPQDAIACYGRALELKPDYADASNNLGNALEQMGDLRGAENCYRAALQHNPRLAQAHGQLAKLLGGRLPENDLIALRRLLEETCLTNAQRWMLHFGLAHVLDARGEYIEAAAHLDRAKALQVVQWRSSGCEYDPQEHENFVTRTIQVQTPEFFQRVRGFGLESAAPVFVVGLPRSGTTLVEQILASHSQVVGAGEITLVSDTVAALVGPCGDFIDSLGALDRPTAQRVAARHLERLLSSLGPAALCVVDKTPENYLYLGLLVSLFPQAKLIHCRRNLRDVAVSCWMTSFGKLRNWANDPQHIASRYHQYERLMEHWRKVLPAPLLEVDYEDTVADLESTARTLVAGCKLDWEPGCLKFHEAKRSVSTASMVQVRQPVYTSSVGRWKNYEQPLASLLAGIAPTREAVTVDD